MKMVFIKRKINKFLVFLISFLLTVFFLGKDYEGLKYLEKQSKKLIQKDIIKVTYADHSSCESCGGCNCCLGNCNEEAICN